MPPPPTAVETSAVRARALGDSDPLLLHILPWDLPPALPHPIEHFCDSDFYGECGFMGKSLEDVTSVDCGGLLRSTCCKTRRVAYGWRDVPHPRGADETKERAVLEGL